MAKQRARGIFIESDAIMWTHRRALKGPSLSLMRATITATSAAAPHAW